MSGVLHHRVDGADDGPPLILGPSLGTSMAVWEPQVPALSATHRVLRWDLPGHGGSPPGLISAGATVADLGRLVLAMADALGVTTFGYAGISLGGAVGLWLAVNHPARLERLAVVCTAARFGEPQGWAERAALVRRQGSTEAVARAAAGRWFTPPFRDEPVAAARAADLRATDPDAYAACCDALAAYDLRADVSRIRAATHVIAGREDPVVPVAWARQLADGIAGAGLTEVAHASHLANLEQPIPVLAALQGHFTVPGPPAVAERTPEDRTVGGDGPLPGDEDARRAAGAAVRRAVLGDAHVDCAMADGTGFTADFQDFITRYAWGEIWTRPGLDRRMRSCVALTALVAGGHHQELALHVRAGLRNGLTAEQIREVLLQTAVYCGVPAANTAFAIAHRVLAETGDG